MAITIDGAGTITGITEGGLNDGIITENELVAAVTPIGVGQTWTDVAGSRALGTTFTNSTGRPIQVNIVASRSNATATLGITVGGVLTGNLVIAQGVQGFVSAVVPDGATYLISSATLTTIHAWAELR